jgi:hypothetical protein
VFSCRSTIDLSFVSAVRFFADLRCKGFNVYLRNKEAYHQLLARIQYSLLIDRPTVPVCECSVNELAVTRKFGAFSVLCQTERHALVAVDFRHGVRAERE